MSLPEIQPTPEEAVQLRMSQPDYREQFHANHARAVEEVPRPAEQAWPDPTPPPVETPGPSPAAPPPPVEPMWAGHTEIPQTAPTSPRGRVSPAFTRGYFARILAPPE
jgi:hypothetical protein